MGGDYFIGTCPECGREFCCRSRLSTGKEAILRKGDFIPNLSSKYSNSTVELKNPCHWCSGWVMVLFSKGELKELMVSRNPEWIEMASGEVLLGKRNERRKV